MYVSLLIYGEMFCEIPEPAVWEKENFITQLISWSLSNCERKVDMFGKM